MNTQKTVDTLRLRYLEESRQNVILRTLVREARACIWCVESGTSELSPRWRADWMRRANALLDQEAPK
jgi:hypothetical protein